MHEQVLWDVQKGEALCGAPLLATDVCCFPGDAQRFATCGADSSLFIWLLNRPACKLGMHRIQARMNRSDACGKAAQWQAHCGTELQRALHGVTCRRILHSMQMSAQSSLQLRLALCVQLGQYKRNFTRLRISQDDQEMYVGSSSGDVAQARHRGIMLRSIAPVSLRLDSHACVIMKRPFPHEYPSMFRSA